MNEAVEDELPLFARAARRGRVLSVSELTAEVRAVVETAFDEEVAVQGEISNFKHYASRHMYFSLKDAEAVLRCVFFHPENRNLRFTPADGLAVVARGRVGVYPPQGAYQLYVATMTPRGEGELMAALERLKKRLAGEGLFDEDRKKPLPRYPRVVAVVTSGEGAAFRDVRTVLSRRWPGLTIVLRPTRVQGAGAAQDIARGIEEVDEWGGADVLIVGRGGGSLEDLWAFNEEVAVRAVAGARTPVISAVGHEVDFTLTDFAADVRAPTPSAAAELCVRVKDDVAAEVRDLLAGAADAAASGLDERRMATDRAAASYGFRAVPRAVGERIQRVDHAAHRAARATAAGVAAASGRFAATATALRALAPAATLARGYNVATRDGLVVKRAAVLAPGDEVRLNFADGGREAVINDDREKSW